MNESKGSYQQIWDQVLEIIGDKFSAPIMDLWFNCLSLEFLSDQYAVLVTKEDYKRDIIQSKYSEYISKCFETVLGFDVMTLIYSSEKFKGDPGPILSNIHERMDKGIPLLPGLDSALSITPKEIDDTEETQSPAEESDSAEESNEPTYYVSEGGSQNNIKSLFTFENFIVGSSNTLAYAACVAVSKKPAVLYNPLFIYGPSGLGKTHLLYAIINTMSERFPKSRIVYVKGETFTNQLIESITYKTTGEFRQKFRKADVLLIDDVQFIAGKVAVQEEIFHTFNELYEAGKQIIFTSDRPPKDINPLEDRIKSRFEQGLIVDIQPPDLELRIAILKRKTQEMGIVVPNEVLSFLGDKLDSNIRQIEGIIKKLRAFCQLNNSQITLELARNSINDIISGVEPVEITIDKIFAKTAKKYGVQVSDIKGKKRTNEIAQARHICIYLIRNLTELSYPSICKLLNRDHSTVMSSIEQVEKKMKESISFDSEIKDLMKEIKNN